jgi:hypothetical protein
MHVPVGFLPVALLTSEATFQLLVVINNRWVKMSEWEFHADMEEAEAVQLLEKLGLVEVVRLPLGEWHCLAQRSTFERWLEIRPTALGSFVTAKFSRLLYAVLEEKSKKGAN